VFGKFSNTTEIAKEDGIFLIINDRAESILELK